MVENSACFLSGVGRDKEGGYAESDARGCKALVKAPVTAGQEIFVFKGVPFIATRSVDIKQQN